MRSRLVGSTMLCLAVLTLPVGAFANRREDHGSIVLVNAATGRQSARIVGNGVIDAAVADGRGGWFVGGSFTRLGSQRHAALAHVLAGGVVDRSWHGSVSGASGRPVAVQALARAGARLYVAGAFGRVGGLHRPGLGAIDTRTGHGVRSWAPKPLLWLDVSALLVAGRRILVAGQFNYPTAGITALDARSGAADRRWNPHLLLIGDAGGFSALMLRRLRVYVAGSFHVAGLRHNGLVALDARNGEPDRQWAPRVSNCSVCNRFALLYGLAASRSRVYVSGAFRRIDGIARAGIAALDPSTGHVVRQWTPARGGTNIVRLALIGDRLYAGGSTGLFALSAATGSRVRLPPVKVPHQVLALIPSGDELLVAGRR
jgi:trimeric autotransporter adhesin